MTMEQLVFELDMIQTLALAAVVLFAGYAIRRKVAVLDRYNIPAAVVGGFLFAAGALALRLAGWVILQFDTSLQAPLMIAFFTTIGLGANLKLFLSMALMSLKLWELLDLAIPMLIILMVQVLMMAAYAYFVVFRSMGRDHDAAVMAGGHCGFGLGATPNAVANMEALTERFGPAPRAFLVIPMVGAFFIDFTNALVITAYINLVT